MTCKTTLNTSFNCLKLKKDFSGATLRKVSQSPVQSYLKVSENKGDYQGCQ